MKPYRFVEEADAEFQEQIRYFDAQLTGLGDKFIDDVEATIALIRQYPDSGAQLSAHVRKRRLRVFRYNVVYVNDPVEIIVVAVASHYRRPGYWRNRLRHTQ